MKLLITGANGQVGHALTQRLKGLGELIALDRQGADLSQPESLVAVLDAHRPDWIINAAAYTAVDKAESEHELAFTI
ncbi:MAG: sugar nucleotide-binding protein, partial [Paraperlucidibaca sp.]